MRTILHALHSGLLIALSLLPVPAPAQWHPLNPIMAVEQLNDGVMFRMQTGVMRIQICTDRIMRVLYSPTSSLPDRIEHLVVKTTWAAAPWTILSTQAETKIATPKVAIAVSWKDGMISFLDVRGNKLFVDHNRTMTPVVVNNEKTYHAEVFSNLWGSSEAFYGLGGHQAGVWNFRGDAVDISQDNTNIGIPLFLSSNGYGIFWNNTSRSRFNNRFLNALYLSAEVADLIDYYFIYGPEFDTILSSYRDLTGPAPLFGKWAYGFWQCKNRYQSQTEILTVARRYRELHIPIDNIVQDWFWWNTMGDPVFDRSRFPDPRGMIDTLHQDHFHFMISVWPYFRPGSKTYQEMNRLGFFIDKTKSPSFHPAGQALYDAFNPEARKYYWNLIDTALFRIGADAWWLDTTEPETEGRETNILATNNVALGNGARYTNMYPLMTTTGVYEGQRKSSDRKRVFILSRSAYAGSQRTATAVWSGDVNSDWVFFKRQIPAGLNYSLSGLPYWTTDIGGFLSANPDDPDYRNLFVRWFQFGSFSPIFRVHGTRTTNQNEVWSYGSEAQKILVNFIRLRYRLFPYVYSLAWMTTNSGYALARPLVMDFRTDVRAANTGDQFMFGPALLVNPVTEPAATSRRVYLPQGLWYDFWTGLPAEGGRSIDSDAPLDRLPLYVRAGSLVPMGPEVQWADEKPADPLELRVYRGASGAFVLYEDEGDSYDYEKGAFATIPFQWDDATRMLTIGARAGGFQGMMTLRTIHIVFVGEHHGVGIDATDAPDKTVQYMGTEIRVSP